MISKHKLLQFLMGLNDSYAHVRSHILMTSPLPSVGQAFAIISQEESHRNISTSVTPLMDSTAFYSSHHKRPPSPRCEHCNWPGHTRENCFKLIGYPPGHRLYKGPGKNHGPKSTKDWHDRPKPSGQANAIMTQVDADALSQSYPTTSSMFTPEQYAAILKLLAQEPSITEPAESSANMAGPYKWEDNGDW
ncbi:uncharacterized protein [Henckelia pumila]|uniref:uncharacterized protein n=1 Tax=Henckelia pumila TaxID=405737 RepID=UPI003C6E7741